MVAIHLQYYDEWKSSVLECPKCGWKGTFEQGWVEYYRDLMDSSCPVCDTMVAIVSFPTTEESRANWDKLTDEGRKQVEDIERFQEEFSRRKLRDASLLPEIQEKSFTLDWDFTDDGFRRETVIKHKDTVIFTEPALYEGYERFVEIAGILRRRYGDALRDLVPTNRSELYLYGDRISSPGIVAEARRRIFSGQIEETPE